MARRRVCLFLNLAAVLHRLPNPSFLPLYSSKQIGARQGLRDHIRKTRKQLKQQKAQQQQQEEEGTSAVASSSKPFDVYQDFAPSETPGLSEYQREQAARAALAAAHGMAPPIDLLPTPAEMSSVHASARSV